MAEASGQSLGIDKAPSTLTTLPVEKASCPEASAATASARDDVFDQCGVRQGAGGVHGDLHSQIVDQRHVVVVAGTLPRDLGLSPGRLMQGSAAVGVLLSSELNGLTKVRMKTLDFFEPLAFERVAAMSDDALGTLAFGVIGFDAEGLVRRYSSVESRLAGLSAERVIGQPLFTLVAPCMNNFMVAQRFEDAATNQATLDDTIDYVLTLRMRPTKVRLRLLAGPKQPYRFILVDRRV